jgi:hypothetical protein
VTQIRVQVPLPETADELCVVARDLRVDGNDIRRRPISNVLAKQASYPSIASSTSRPRVHLPARSAAIPNLACS